MQQLKENDTKKNATLILKSKNLESKVKDVKDDKLIKLIKLINEYITYYNSLNLEEKPKFLSDDEYNILITKLNYIFILDIPLLPKYLDLNNNITTLVHEFLSFIYAQQHKIYKL